MSTPANICDECNHPVEKHGPDGCECDRKVFVDGIEIAGLCGCTVIRASND